MRLRKLLFLSCSVLLVVILIIFTLEKSNIVNFYHKNPQTSYTTRAVNSVDYSPPRSTDNDDINAAKQDGTIDKQPVSKPINITITRAVQDTNKTLIVRTLVSGQSSGTCKLELVKGDNDPFLTKNVSISQQNNVFVCNGFDITSSELPGVGEWTIRVSASGGGNTDISSQNIMLEK